MPKNASTGRECWSRQAAGDGFANQLDRLFNRYFARVAPAGVDGRYWPVQTAGYRDTLRDELAELYRESRVGAARIRWLVRHLAREVRLGWDAGTLWHYRDRYCTPISVRVATCLGILALVPALVLSVVSGVLADPVLGRPGRFR